MRRSIAVSEYDATLTKITALTHDIRLLEMRLSRPLRFWAGQYVDLTIPGAGITRSFSMANTPDGEPVLQFIIKKVFQEATQKIVIHPCRMRPGGIDFRR